MYIIGDGPLEGARMYCQQNSCSGNATVMIWELMASTGAVVCHGCIASMTNATRKKKFSTCLGSDAWGTTIH